MLLEAGYEVGCSSKRRGNPEALALGGAAVVKRLALSSDVPALRGGPRGLRARGPWGVSHGHSHVNRHENEPGPVNNSVGKRTPGGIITTRWDQELWLSKSMVIPQNPKNNYFHCFFNIFFEIVAISRSRDREKWIPIDLDRFRPNLSYFISI